MKKIEDIDKNFSATQIANPDDYEFYDIEEAPFSIYGVFKENNHFLRMPSEIAKNVSDGVSILNKNTAGGRIRFNTDSDDIIILAELNNAYHMSHMPATGSRGFDLYENTNGIEQYTGSFTPPPELAEKYTSILSKFKNRGIHKLTVNMPLYCGVNKVHIGIKKGSVLEAAEPYAHEKPIVYYGSSITQGGCASRPGMSYQSIISRKLDCNFINLGFSGSARGEQSITDYIKSLDMSLFVLDYDHNAPTPEHLNKTHQKMFCDIRSAHPELPVIMLSRPAYILSQEEIVRRDIVKKTYTDAVARGDKNVYFIDGSTIMNDFLGNDGTVDGCHPTDSGFVCMAQSLIPIIKSVYNS